MSIISYTLMAYGLTAAISLMVIGIVLVLNRVMSKAGTEEEEDND